MRCRQYLFMKDLLMLNKIILQNFNDCGQMNFHAALKLFGNNKLQSNNYVGVALYLGNKIQLNSK